MTTQALTSQAQRSPALKVNGEDTAIGDVPVHTTALDWLRDRGLTGAKEGCAEGECGACSVLVARPGIDTATEWTAVNACLLPIASLDGQEIITSEGLGSPTALHPVQEEMAVRGGSQCGYCTPGFICSMAAEYYRPDRRPAAAAGPNGSGTPVTGSHEMGPNGPGLPAAPDDERQGNGTAAAAGPHQPNGSGPADDEHGPNGFDLHALSGNLCRCTGYRPIRDAAYALGQPEAGDPLTARLAAPAPATV